MILTTPAEGIGRRVLEEVTDGGMIELHLDSTATEQSTPAPLQGIIAELQTRGYTLELVPKIVFPCPAAP